MMGLQIKKAFISSKVKMYIRIFTLVPVLLAEACVAQVTVKEEFLYAYGKRGVCNSELLDLNEAQIHSCDERKSLQNDVFSVAQGIADYPVVEDDYARCAKSGHLLSARYNAANNESAFLMILSLTAACYQYSDQDDLALDSYRKFFRQVENLDDEILDPTIVIEALFNRADLFRRRGERSLSSNDYCTILSEIGKIPAERRDFPLIAHLMRDIDIDELRSLCTD